MRVAKPATTVRLETRADTRPLDGNGDGAKRGLYTRFARAPACTSALPARTKVPVGSLGGLRTWRPSEHCARARKSVFFLSFPPGSQRFLLQSFLRRPGVSLLSCSFYHLLDGGRIARRETDVERTGSRTRQTSLCRNDAAEDSLLRKSIAGARWSHTILHNTTQWGCG